MYKTKHGPAAMLRGMRKLINSTFITFDGVIENPHLWPSLGRPADERDGQMQTELLLSCDALLMGRRTYESFAPAWSARSGDPYSDYINVMPKYVVSRTLKTPEWQNTRLIDSDPVAAVTHMKQKPGKDIIQYGFGQLSRLLISHGLIDEVRLWVTPLLLGRGSASDLLFRPVPSPVAFRLVETKGFNNGVVLLSYEYERLLGEDA